jgi:hypothetical protein
MGVPAFPETSTSEFGQVWTDCAKRAIGVTKSWGEIMGPSVHSVQINGQHFPKYVYSQESGEVRPEHRDLVSSLLAA